MQVRQVAAAMVLACGLATVQAQSTGAKNAGSIDAALLEKANGGDAAALVAVGDCYAEGKGVARNYALAADWYRKAAEKNDTAAEMRLAALYRDGAKGFQRDMAQGALWYRKAAEQGDVTAQATMGTLYAMGQGVPQSYVEAYYWLDLAAAVKGPKQAQYAANRQMMGAHITADELADVQDREAKWKENHPRPDSAQ
jgi:uncharacterized protein